MLDDLKETTGYWKLKEETPDRTVGKSLWKGLCTCRNAGWTNYDTESFIDTIITMYRGADKSLARPGRKQAIVSVRTA